MAFITKYGGFWGMIPVTSGRVFWVSPSDEYTVEGRTYRASDDNDGLQPERAVRTVNRAVALATASVGDVIVLLPGTHKPLASGANDTVQTAASIAISKAGLTVTGLPGAASVPGSLGAGSGRNQRTIIAHTTLQDELMNVTAADVEIAYIHFDVQGALATPAQQGLDIAAARCFVHDCTFDNSITGTSDTACISLELLSGADHTVIRNCYFMAQHNTGPALRLTSANYTVLEQSTFEWLPASGTAWDDVIECVSSVVGLTIRDVDVISNNTTDIVDVVELSGATTDETTNVRRCYFPVGSDPFEPAAAADVSMAQCWLLEISGGTGGTAVVA